jgi:hypothetical protein
MPVKTKTNDATPDVAGEMNRVVVTGAVAGRRSAVLTTTNERRLWVTLEQIDGSGRAKQVVVVADGVKGDQLGRVEEGARMEVEGYVGEGNGWNVLLMVKEFTVVPVDGIIENANHVRLVGTYKGVKYKTLTRELEELYEMKVDVEGIKSVKVSGKVLGDLKDMKPGGQVEVTGRVVAFEPRKGKGVGKGKEKDATRMCVYAAQLAALS